MTGLGGRRTISFLHRFLLAFNASPAQNGGERERREGLSLTRNSASPPGP